MATILLVRHATTAATGKRLGGWTPGVHLDRGGAMQAAAVGARLADANVAAVYASPLERTQDTAKAIASACGRRVRTRRGLGEVDYGEWTDKPLGQLRRRKLWPVIQQTPSRVTFPGGESIRGAQQRAVTTIEEIASEHGDEVVVAVSHADIIKAVAAHYLGMPLDMFQRILVMPASVTTIVLRDGHPPFVVGLNDVAHLTGAA